MPSWIVGAQVAALAVVLLGGAWWPLPWWWWAITALAAVGMAWSVALMGRHLRIEPKPAAGAPLLCRGPYRWIRHPMYTSLLTASLALVIAQPSWWRVAGWMGLVVVLLLKIRTEERHLVDQVAGYAAYRARTGRLFPRMIG